MEETFLQALTEAAVAVVWMQQTDSLVMEEATAAMEVTLIIVKAEPAREQPPRHLVKTLGQNTLAPVEAFV